MNPCIEPKWSSEGLEVDLSKEWPTVRVKLYELRMLQYERDRYKLERGFAIILAVLTTIGWGIAAL